MARPAKALHKEKPASPESVQQKQGDTKVIAIAQIRHEINVFSPVKTTQLDFEANGLLYGQEIMEKGLDEELGGFMKAVNELGNGTVKIVPIVRASAMPGGLLDKEFYKRLKEEILQGLIDIEQLDGLYISMHGSMGVEGLCDPEGDLLQAIRDQNGPDLPIAISFDLHANVTEADAKLATFIVGYRTNPHRDHTIVGYTAARILIRTVRGEIEPTMAYRKMRLLKGGGMNIDFLRPMRTVFKRMKQMERQQDVLSVSTYMVHIWLDEPEVGWSVIVVTDHNPALAEELAEELADLNWSKRGYNHPDAFTAAEAIKIARRNWLSRMMGAVIFCDIADAVSAGAPGENTWILKALLEEGADLKSYISLKDADAVREAFETPLNQKITLSVGGKLDQKYNRPVEVTGTVISKTEGRYGKTVILKHKGIHLVLTELPAAVKKPGFYLELGLSLWKADIVVVKNLFPFRFWFMLYNRKTVNIITPGTTNVDVFGLDYNNIPRPIYPLDEIPDWR